MIYGYVGDIGSGKTLTMVKYAWYHYLSGYNVYSNIHLEFPHVKIDDKFIKDIVKSDAALKGKNIFILDEVDLYMDSRRSMKEANLIIGYFVKQVRKKSIKLFYAVQFLDMVDKRLRNLTMVKTICTSKDINFFMPGNDEPVTFTYIYNESFKGDRLVSKKRFLANPFFQLYDTKELVKVPVDEN